MSCSSSEDEEEKTLSEILFSLDDIGEWHDEFMKRKDKIDRILERIEKKGDEVYPRKKDVFNCFRLTPLETAKVVIWGQDPYPKLLINGETRAQGYSFGVSRDDCIPQSLKNIYKEIGDNFDCFKAPNHGDLRWLAKQGILFLNASLTYNPNDPKSHQNIWGRFTHIVIEILNKKIENCIHVLWGRESEKLAPQIASTQILNAAHPSPFSAYRGFFGCRHFYKINIILDRQGKKQINWNEDKTLPKTRVTKKEKKKTKKKDA
jgi:uracil-DNA glycosylase